jgi:hypothetical protein
VFAVSSKICRIFFHEMSTKIYRVVVNFIKTIAVKSRTLLMSLKDFVLILRHLLSSFGESQCKVSALNAVRH